MCLYFFSVNGTCILIFLCAMRCTSLNIVLTSSEKFVQLLTYQHSHDADSSVISRACPFCASSQWLQLLQDWPESRRSVLSFQFCLFQNVICSLLSLFFFSLYLMCGPGSFTYTHTHILHISISFHC